MASNSRSLNLSNEEDRKLNSKNKSNVILKLWRLIESKCKVNGREAFAPDRKRALSSPPPSARKRSALDTSSGIGHRGLRYISYERSLLNGSSRSGINHHYFAGAATAPTRKLLRPALCRGGSRYICGESDAEVIWRDAYDESSFVLLLPNRRKDNAPGLLIVF